MDDKRKPTQGMKNDYAADFENSQGMNEQIREMFKKPALPRTTVVVTPREGPERRKSPRREADK